jgi:hypothetical protein
MEHHDWEWSSDDDGAGHGDAETADLTGGDDLGHSDGFTDFGDSDHDLGGDPGGHDDLGGHTLDRDSLDEPLGTENAVGAYDADTGFDHDDPGHTDPSDNNDHDPGVPDHDAVAATDQDHGPGAASDPSAHDGATDPAAHDGSPPDPSGHDGQPDPGAHDGQPDPVGHDDPAAGDHATDHTFEVNDGHGDATGDHLVGVDPDLDHRADDPGWHDDPFPPELHLETTPEPVDGFPWVDPAILGGHDADAFTHAVTGDTTPDGHDLASYHGIEVPSGGDPWTALFGAEDPATSNLAQWWAPNA